MNDGDATSTLRLAELLRHPDDLHKISALKADFTRKKTGVDAQLKLGLTEQLELTKAGMASMQSSARTIAEIKEEMIKIDRLCAEAQLMIRNFPEINAVAQAHRNFAAVEAMQLNIETFDDKLNGIMRLLQEDEDNIEIQPHLLEVHYGITQLRQIRDDAMEQIKRADDPSLEETLHGVFKKLDVAIDDFDGNVGQACINLIPLVNGENTSLIVRLAIVIEEEEKFDLRMKELQQAQKEFKDLAPRFKALAAGNTELRGYKDKFLEAIKLFAQTQIDASNEAFMDNPDRLDKSLRWYFNDLNAVKKGMVPLMPKKWKIFSTYTKIYHTLLREWLLARSVDKEIAPTHMLAIIHFKDLYNDKMINKLKANPADMEPPLPGGNDSDLVREYRQLIVDKVEEWMNNMNKTDREAFVAREESALDRDEHGLFRTKTLGDMWRMLREQLLVASTAELSDVTEGVTDAMFRALKTRLDMWTELVNGELARYTRSSQAGGEPITEGIQALQDWLIAIANDQIVSIADAEANFGTLGYLPLFQRDYSALVSQDYVASSEDKAETLKEGVTDLGFRCITIFVKLIFAVDFRNIMADFFTPAWYAGAHGGAGMGAIVSTFDDYLGDYADVLHPLLRELLIVELSKKLLAAYLSAVRNKGAKFRRTDPYNARLKDDITTAFRFFERFPEAFDDIKEEWKVLQRSIALVEADKHAIGAEFRIFVGEYWDVKMGWVEALLRTRDDIDWGPLGDGKSIMKSIRAEAANLRVQGQLDTIMAEVT